MCDLLWADPLEDFGDHVTEGKHREGEGGEGRRGKEREGEGRRGKGMPPSSGPMCDLLWADPLEDFGDHVTEGKHREGEGRGGGKRKGGRDGRGKGRGVWTC
jgi:hypothetical protein